MNTVQAVGVVVFQLNKVLLVKHTDAASHLTGTYGLPSGRVEHGESLEEAAVRELREETGLIARELFKLEDTYFAEIERKSGERVPFEWSVFLCGEYSGLLHESEETIPEWVPIDKVRSLSLLPNTDTAIKKAESLMRSKA